MEGLCLQILCMSIFGVWLYRTETFCWWAKDGDHEIIILSFDMANAQFKRTPLPSDVEDLGGAHRITRAIVPMNECIALIVYPQKQVEKFFELWVMKEFGVKESWTRLSTIGPLLRIGRPVGFWNNGEFILENSFGDLVLFDNCSKQIKNLGLQGKRDRLELVVNIESLVALNSGNES